MTGLGTETSPPASAGAAPGGTRPGLGRRGRCPGKAASGCRGAPASSPGPPAWSGPPLPGSAFPGRRAPRPLGLRGAAAASGHGPLLRVLVAVGDGPGDPGCGLPPDALLPAGLALRFAAALTGARVPHGAGGDCSARSPGPSPRIRLPRPRPSCGGGALRGTLKCLQPLGPEAGKGSRGCPQPTQGAWQEAVVCPRGTQGPSLSPSQPEGPRAVRGQTLTGTSCAPGTKGVQGEARCPPSGGPGRMAGAVARETLDSAPQPRLRPLPAPWHPLIIRVPAGVTCGIERVTERGQRPEGLAV